MQPIAVIYNDFPEKFGLPRQSGLAPDLVSRIVMEKKYRIPEAFRGIEAFSHLWLLWEFNIICPDDPTNGEEVFYPTVRPPKLGGNERIGVFASRSPNRPNRIGLTLVKLIRLEDDPEKGPVLVVSGADMMNGTRILDIKPYLPYVDSVPDAKGSFTAALADNSLPVFWETESPEEMGEEQKRALEEVLSLDPRPGYQKDPERIYRMSYAKWTVMFRVDKQIHVCRIIPEGEE